MTFASVMATAAPIVASAPCDADPSADDAASVFALEASVTVPPDGDGDARGQQRLRTHGGEGDRDGRRGVDLSRGRLRARRRGRAGSGAAVRGGGGVGVVALGIHRVRDARARPAARAAVLGCAGRRGGCRGTRHRDADRPHRHGRRRRRRCGRAQRSPCGSRSSARVPRPIPASPGTEHGGRRGRRGRRLLGRGGGRRRSRSACPVPIRVQVRDVRERHGDRGREGDVAAGGAHPRLGHRRVRGGRGRG